MENAQEEKIDIEFKANFKDSVSIILSAANWRTDNGIKYSQFWDPSKISEEKLLEEFYPEDAYVLYVNSMPIATAILTNENKTKIPFWGETLGKEYSRTDCLYLDQISVISEKIGQGYVYTLFKEIEKHAITLGYKSLRLDVDSDLEKLTEVYKKCGFSEVHKKGVGYRTSIFMEKAL